MPKKRNKTEQWHEAEFEGARGNFVAKFQALVAAPLQTRLCRAFGYRVNKRINKRMQDIKLPYALKDGEVVHISEVERGLKCECICPVCKERLIARKGEQRIDHFAHYSTGTCQGGLETGLHLAAKKILESCHSIVLPPIMIDFGYSEPTWISNGFVLSGLYGQFLKPIKLCDKSRHSVSEVFVEQTIGDIIPDILLYINNTPLILEIYVTHKIDREKLQKIQQSKISAIEIDLSKIDKSFYSYEALKNILIDDISCKTWVYNRKYELDVSNINPKIIEIKHVLDHYWCERVFGNIIDGYVKDCPKNSIVLNGISYANTHDDCDGCEYVLDRLSRDDGEDDSIIFCGGRHKITSVEQLRKLLRIMA